MLTQAGEQLPRRVLQAEGQQQEDDPDLGAELDELLAGVQREQSTTSEGKPTQEEERDRRDPNDVGDVPEHTEGE